MNNLGGKTLCTAIIDKDYRALQSLLKSGVNPNETLCKNKDIGVCTPLAIAISRLDERAVKILLDNGADPNYKNLKGYTPSRAFIKHQCPLSVPNDTVNKKTFCKIIKLLMAHNLNIDDFVDDASNTLLSLACMHCNFEGVKDIKAFPPETIEALTETGADVNIANVAGQTPLMHVAKGDSKQNEAVFVTLLDKGAAINITDSKGNTPLMYAAKNPNNLMGIKIAKMLFDFGDPKLDAVNDQGKSAMRIAAESNNQPLVLSLIMKM